MPSSRYTLLAVIITFVTISGIFHWLVGTQASVTPSSARNASPQVIGGRWQLVRASLGLEHLPATNIASPLPTDRPLASRRVDFRRRKRAAPSRLHFTRDALHKPRVSLKELIVLLRRVALEETKADSPHSETKKGRDHLGRVSARKRQTARSR